LGDLGNLWPADSAAYGINDAGQVVGGSYNDAGDFHAFLWNGAMQDLGTLGGDTGTAMAINEKGQVVGSSRPAGSIPVHAFLWDGGMKRGRWSARCKTDSPYQPLTLSCGRMVRCRTSTT
jgi:probable HAF family extracellular repeat protein